jgi:hypothetical protein
MSSAIQSGRCSACVTLVPAYVKVETLALDSAGMMKPHPANLNFVWNLQSLSLTFSSLPLQPPWSTVFESPLQIRFAGSYCFALFR